MRPKETQVLEPSLSRVFLRGKKFAVVKSVFHEKICEALFDGVVRTFESYGMSADQFKVFTVPGAFEIPFLAKKVAASGEFDGVIALGCVIRGETPHFDFISLATAMGCLQVGLETGCPVSFGVITANNEAQALERSMQNGTNKGCEAAVALFDVLETLEDL